MTDHLPTAAQTVGPFFSIGLGWLASPPVDRDVPAVGGTLYDGQGAGVRDAILEVWSLDGAREARFQRLATDEAGHFEWPLPPATERPACWSVWIFARGLLQPLLTRVYLAAPVSDAADPFWHAVPAARRATLLAARGAGAVERYRWDVRLQTAPDGSAETAFFACHHPRGDGA